MIVAVQQPSVKYAKIDSFVFFYFEDIILQTSTKPTLFLIEQSGK